jgi:hypothetical protein
MQFQRKEEEMKDVYAMVMELEKALNEEREKISEM